MEIAIYLVGFVMGWTTLLLVTQLDLPLWARLLFYLGCAAIGLLILIGIISFTSEEQ